MDINLVAADASLAEKTICLAVSPSLKAYGIPGRARLFEVIQKVNKANEKCRRNTPDRSFTGKSAYGIWFGRDACTTIARMNIAASHENIAEAYDKIIKRLKI